MDLGQFIGERMERLGLSAAALARLLRVKPPFIFAVRKGERGIPPKRVDAWADALGLTGNERRAFTIAALLPRCPAQIRDYIHELESTRTQ